MATRRQRQKRNKLVAKSLKEAVEMLQKKEDDYFPLRSIFGYIDPVPREAWFRGRINQQLNNWRFE